MTGAEDIVPVTTCPEEQELQPESQAGAQLKQSSTTGASTTG